MPVNTVSSTNLATSSNATASAVKDANALDSKDFLTLLITQLQNQDPLNPMNDREFIAQMAQLSSLDTTKGMSKQLTDLIGAQQRTQALQMVGRDIDYTNDTDGTQQTGRVSAVVLQGERPQLLIGDKRVDFLSVQFVH